MYPLDWSPINPLISALYLFVVLYDGFHFLKGEISLMKGGSYTELRV